MKRKTKKNCALHLFETALELYTSIFTDLYTYLWPKGYNGSMRWNRNPSLGLHIRPGCSSSDRAEAKVSISSVLARSASSCASV